MLSEAGDCVPGILYGGAPYAKSVIGDLSLFMPTSWVARASKLLLGAKLSKRPRTLRISFLNIGQFLNYLIVDDADEVENEVGAAEHFC